MLKRFTFNPVLRRAILHTSQTPNFLTHYHSTPIFYQPVPFRNFGKKTKEKKQDKKAQEKDQIKEEFADVDTDDIK